MNWASPGWIRNWSRFSDGKYRTSYGQNILNHSTEVAFWPACWPEELAPMSPSPKKSGLLHDIGKAVDHEVAGTHPEIGRDNLQEIGVPEEVDYRGF